MKKYKIGYTTGVFDMFHIGHLNILKKSKEYCDFLIVGVSTDELVEKYKHKTPVIPYEQRREIVEAIKYVDRVVPQINMDKLQAWEKYRFEVIFHGDDWKNSEMYKQVENEMKQKGVDLVFIPHTEGVSSTIIYRKINDAKK